MMKRSLSGQNKMASGLVLNASWDRGSTLMATTGQGRLGLGRTLDASPPCSMQKETPGRIRRAPNRLRALPWECKRLEPARQSRGE